MKFVGWFHFKNLVAEGAFEDKFGRSHNIPVTTNVLTR